MVDTTAPQRTGPRLDRDAPPCIDARGRPRPFGMPSFVYVMRCTDEDWVKIGRSASPGVRARAVSNAVGKNVEVLAVVPGYVQVEAALHQRFAHLHVEGEWFRWAPEIEEWVERARTTFALWEALVAEADLT